MTISAAKSSPSSSRSSSKTAAKPKATSNPQAAAKPEAAKTQPAEAERKVASAADVAASRKGAAAAEQQAKATALGAEAPKAEAAKRGLTEQAADIAGSAAKIAKSKPAKVASMTKNLAEAKRHFSEGLEHLRAGEREKALDSAGKMMKSLAAAAQDGYAALPDNVKNMIKNGGKLAKGIARFGGITAAVAAASDMTKAGDAYGNLMANPTAENFNRFMWDASKAGLSVASMAPALGVGPALAAGAMDIAESIYDSREAIGNAISDAFTNPPDLSEFHGA